MGEREEPWQRAGFQISQFEVRSDELLFQQLLLQEFVAGVATKQEQNQPSHIPFIFSFLSLKIFFSIHPWCGMFTSLFNISEITFQKSENSHLLYKRKQQNGNGNLKIIFVIRLELKSSKQPRKGLALHYKIEVLYSNAENSFTSPFISSRSIFKYLHECGKSLAEMMQY